MSYGTVFILNYNTYIRYTPVKLSQCTNTLPIPNDTLITNIYLPIEPSRYVKSTGHKNGCVDYCAYFKFYT